MTKKPTPRRKGRPIPQAQMADLTAAIKRATVLQAENTLLKQQKAAEKYEKEQALNREKELKRVVEELAAFPEGAPWRRGNGPLSYSHFDQPGAVELSRCTLWVLYADERCKPA